MGPAAPEPSALPMKNLNSAGTSARNEFTTLLNVLRLQEIIFAKRSEKTGAMPWQRSQQPSALSGKEKGRNPVSQINQENTKASPTRSGSGRRRVPKPSREFCLCGHRATVHAAYRYACQAPGDRKGFCECMRFITRNSPVGKRLRALARSKAVPAVGPK